MNIVEMNIGEKIAYKINGNKISLRDELTLDLSKYERDYKVKLDICENKDGILIFGLSDYYVAQLEIPERQYREETIGENEEAETTRVALAFDINRVTLVLWAINGGVI